MAASPSGWLPFFVFLPFPVYLFPKRSLSYTLSRGNPYTLTATYPSAENKNTVTMPLKIESVHYLYGSTTEGSYSLSFGDASGLPLLKKSLHNAVLLLPAAITTSTTECSGILLPIQKTCLSGNTVQKQDGTNVLNGLPILSRT